MSDKPDQHDDADEQGRLRATVVHLDAVLEQLAEHGERTWREEPVAKALHLLRNQIVHGVNQSASVEMAGVVETVVSLLKLIESSSLGTAPSHRIRRLSSAGDVAAILTRADELAAGPRTSTAVLAKSESATAEELAVSVSAEQKVMAGAGVRTSTVAAIFATDLGSDSAPARDGDEAAREDSPEVPGHKVEVQRSQRRHRTVTAYWRDDTLVVLIPARMTKAEEKHWVAEMERKLRRPELPRPAPPVQQADPAVEDYVMLEDLPRPHGKLTNELLNPVVLAASTGDADAINAVMKLIKPLIVRYCRARIGGRELAYLSADDVAHEVCVAVLQVLPTYSDHRRPFLYLVRAIASDQVDEALDAVTHHRAEPVPELPDRPLGGTQPESRAPETDLGEMLNRWIATLPPEEREIMTLRVICGLSAIETAEALGISQGRVRAQQYYAFTKLHDIAGDLEL
uniref:sigma-70 family RNA polymerase sigma factor n=1 Tax=Amycolatopsis sp. CA-082387 TaxID=3239918 RepID=UPI003F4912BE